MIKIKLCGVSCPEDVELVNRLHPDYVGFLFINDPQQIDQKTAASLRKRLDPSIEVIGVFENERPLFITNLLRQGIIDAVQLRGRETEDDIQAIRQQVNCPVLQMVRVETPADVLRSEWSVADYLLLTGTADAPGNAFNHALARYSRRPFFLAGGLNPGNVKDAIKACHPYAVDVRTGIRTNGRMDPEKAEEFIRQVREAELELEA